MAVQGVYVAYDPNDGQAAIIESAAERALWIAVERGLKVVFWPFGVDLNEAITAGVTKPLTTRGKS
jgi:hypothetical protein